MRIPTTARRPGSRGTVGAIRRGAALTALAAALLAGSQGLSSAGHLDGRAAHWDGHPETTGLFNPSFSVDPLTATADSIADGDLTIRVKQPDYNEVIRSHRVVLPGWRFAVENMPASPLARCGAASSTTSTTSADHVVNKMEAVGRLGVRLHTDPTRDPNDHPGDPAPGIANYGTFHSGAEHKWLWFLGWAPDVDPDTGTPTGTGVATLCGLINTANARIPSANRTLMVQVLLERLLDPAGDAFWEISWDFMPAPGDEAKPESGSNPRRSILDKASFQDDNVSILDVEMTLFRLTMGNRTGRPFIFARTPAGPGYYTVAGAFTPCRDADDPPLPCASSVPEVTRTQTITVTTPPDSLIRDFGRLTGPSGPAGMPDRFVLLQGEPSVTFTWSQPATHPGFPLKGYVLAVAVPHVQATIHYEYLITNPSYGPDFDPRRPCGPDGAAPACSLTLTFPLETVGGTRLSPSGKYAAALITVYADEGRRTDGRCDDGTPQGVECSPFMPPTRVMEHRNKQELWLNGGRHGISGLEFMMLPKEWPNVFLQTIETPLSGAAYKVRAPHSLLLADFASTPKDAAYVLWNAHLPTFGTYPGTGQAGIQGVDGQGGVVSFGFHVGTNEQYRFDGAVREESAQGLFVRYDSRDMASPAITEPDDPPAGTALTGYVTTYLPSYVARYQRCETFGLEFCWSFQGSRI